MIFLEKYLNKIKKVFLFYLYSLRIKILEFLSNKSILLLDHKSKIKLLVTNQEEFNRIHSCLKEPGTVNWIEKKFKPNEVFYDIGACTGSYSFVAANKFPKKITVYAFEPDVATYTNLCRNIMLNKLTSNIIPLNIALSNKTTFKQFHYRNLESGTAEHKGLETNNLTRQNRNEEMFKQLMPTFKLDYLITKANLKFPNHIKIDVDGHEFNVLLGAKDSLNDNRLRSIQIEIEEGNTQTALITNMLKKSGFIINQKNRHYNTKIFDYVFVRN